MWANILVPEGDAPLPMEQHLRFFDHMAQLHARFWGWTDRIGLTPLTHRYLLFHPSVMECEVGTGAGAPVPPLVLQGWQMLGERSPEMARVLLPLFETPNPLLDALGRTPMTFVHGDWKAGNLGSLPDGRTILLDWAVPGQAPPCGELGWYLALNAARLPHSKEETIAAYRAALERHGVDAEPWWESQLPLALLGTMVQIGWEKALGGEAELRWWEERVAHGARYLEAQ